MVDPLTSDGLWLTATLWDTMRRDVQSRLPNEACGLVGGLRGRALQIFSIANVLHSPVRFRMDPAEQIRTFLDLEAHGWDLLAIYHSHPVGPDHPSPTDLAESAYPEAVNLIWSCRTGEWRCRAFYITEQKSVEVSIRLINE